MRTMMAGFAALVFLACAAPETREAIQPLVDAAWLSERLDDVVVLDIRAEAAAGRGYLTSHIPGALHAPYGTGRWRGTRDGVPGMLPPVADLERLIGGLGISNDDHVVIVAAGSSTAELGSATRVYWTFKVLGHERVSILDGGFAAWRAARYPVEAGRNTRAPASFVADYQPQLVASIADVMAARANGVPLIDARSVEYYRGTAKSRTAARYGTIAGAENVPFENMTVDNGGAFVGPEMIASLWEQSGVPLEGEQIAFCNTGHLASLAWFSAYEVLGNKRARLYDGSVAEWSADLDLPMDHTADPDSR